jgi:hypothetical protein
MSIPPTHIALDYSVNALFPHHTNPDQDGRCLVIAEVVGQLARRANRDGVTQLTLQEQAKERYAELSRKDTLSLPHADHAAFVLFQQGVTQETAKNYYSFRLTRQQARTWSILLI